MNRMVTTLAGAALILALAPVATAQDDGSAMTSEDASGWNATVLPQTEYIPALASGVAVGPTSMVVVGQRTCELKRNTDVGRCWGQPWISTDGSTWEAAPARTSGLDLGTFAIATSGPEMGIDGLAYGPAGFIAYGWARRDVAADRGAVVPTLWRSSDGRSWERLPTPEGFVVTDGLMLPGPWLRTIVGSEAGYLLGGTIYGKPAPRAAIWSSPDGLTWTLAEGDQVFDVGAYIDTMEVPGAGGIAALAVTPAASESSVAVIAVGPVCPEAQEGAGPKRGFRDVEWTTGVCRPQLWRTTDGLTWETGDLGRESGYPMTVAGNATGWVAGLTAGTPDSEAVVFSEDTFAWEDAAGGPVGQQGALTTTDDAFHALIQTCENESCRRRGLDLWSSPDGLTWSRAAAQPTMPDGVDDFMRVSAAAAGDRIVVAAGYFDVPGGDLASMALLSPPLSVAATPSSDASVEVVSLPPADAAPLPDTVATPSGRIAYVTGAEDDGGRIRLLQTDTGKDTPLTRGTEPSWSPDGAGLAYTCGLDGDVTTSSICTMGVASEASERIVGNGWGPRWSPTGESIAFSRSRVDMGDAWVRELVSESTVPLAGADPVWSPDGKWLMVTSGSGVPYVTLVRPDGSDQRVLGPGWNATWSPDGQRIASAWAGDEGTVVSAMDGTTGEVAPLFAVEGAILAMAWLPGDTMAIVNGGTNGGDLYAVDLENGSVRSLTSDITVQPGSELAVSPDGQWLAFSAVAPEGQTDIYLASVDGGWRQLTAQGDASMPAWAP